MKEVWKKYMCSLWCVCEPASALTQWVPVRVRVHLHNAVATNHGVGTVWKETPTTSQAEKIFSTSRTRYFSLAV